MGDLYNDERIKSKVLVELGVEGVERENINVEAQNGVVTVTGVVEDPQLRNKVEDIVRRQPGVREVETNLMAEPTRLTE